MKASLSALVILLQVGIIPVFGDKTVVKRENLESLHQADSHNGLFGVASVAGIASRNGRVSALGGVQIYPGLEDTFTLVNDDPNFLYQSPKEGGKFIYSTPKENGDKYARGSIEMYPGSVLVSSTSRSGFPDSFKPVNPNLNRPSLKEFFFQPLPEFFQKSRSFEPAQPWFLKDMFAFAPPRPQGLDAWLYPNFNPFFNIWR